MSYASFGALALLLRALVTIRADPVIYFSEDLGLGTGGSYRNSLSAATDFLNEFIQFETEDFSSFNGGVSAPISGTVNSIGYTISGVDGSVPHVENVAGFGRFPISPPNYLDVPTSTFIIEFDKPVVAFGFYGTDVGDFAGVLILELMNGDTKRIPVPHQLGTFDGSVLYFGMIDANEPFLKVSFINAGSSADIFGFDNFTIGTLDNLIPDLGKPCQSNRDCTNCCSTSLLRRYLRGLLYGGTDFGVCLLAAECV